MYSDVFTGIGKFPGMPYKFQLKENVKPTRHAPRKVPIHLQDAFHKEIHNLEKLGILEETKDVTEWVNSFVIMEKKTPDVSNSQSDRKLRICLDPRDLNEALEREPYYTQSIEEIMTRFHGMTRFTIAHFNKGYWMVELNPESQKYTTMALDIGRFQWTRLPMGSIVAQDVFQRKLDAIFLDIPGVTGIADDMVIYGKTDLEHDRHLINFLNICRKNTLMLNPVQTSYRIMVAVKMMDLPEDVETMQSFLGLVNYLNRFSPHLAELSEPLREVCRQDTEFQLTKSVRGAFLKTKEEISKNVTLPYSNLRSDTTLQTASKEELDAVIPQTASKEKLDAVILQTASKEELDAVIPQTASKEELGAVTLQNSKLTYAMQTHTLGTDLFYCNKIDYLVIRDYFSKYLIIRRLPNSSTHAVIKELGLVFTELGRPFVLRSDNGPCYSLREFHNFLNFYQVDHITSSPHYPQSNGFAEALVGIAKKLMDKSLKEGKPWNFSLLQYRTTPISSTLPSPLEMLTGRKPHLNLPQVPSSIGHNMDTSRIHKELLRRQPTTSTSTGATELEPGQPVFVKEVHGNIWRTATIDQPAAEPDSYWVRFPDNSILRRTRSMIKPRSLPSHFELQAEAQQRNFEGETSSHSHTSPCVL